MKPRTTDAGWTGAILSPAVVLLLVLGTLEVYLRWRDVPSYLAPRPSAVFLALGRDRAELLPALFWTTIASLIGFVASAIIGIIIAILLAGSRLVRRAIYPYTLFFQTVPIVAIAPLLVFWLDAGLESVAVCAFIVSIFPVIANTLAGLLSTDPALVDLFRLYGAGPIARFWKLRLPFALPNIFTGLRVAAGLAVIGTVVAEFLVGLLGDRAGLGVRIVGNIKYGHPDRVFAAVLLASLLGLATFLAVNLASRLSLRRWHASER
jgi:NitT/TauT family transport system permease protein